MSPNPSQKKDLTYHPNTPTLIPSNPHIHFPTPDERRTPTRRSAGGETGRDGIIDEGFRGT